MRLLFLLFFLAPTALAQTVTGTITGTVLDPTDRPIVGANVVVDGTLRGTATDTDGRFQIDGVRAGGTTVVVSAIGFRTQRRDAAVRSGETVTLTFVLSEQAVDIGEVVVLSRETLTGGGIRDLPGSAHFIGAEQLRTHADIDPMRVLREIPGVNIQEEDGYGLRPNIGLRGVGAERTNKITVMEDGVLVAPAPYAAPAAYYFPTVGRMSGIEVRKGASQIRYGPFTTAGALNLLSTPIPAERTAYFEGFLGENEARNAHVYVGSQGRNVGFLLETHQSNVAGFKQITGLEDLDTGFDKQDYLGKLRVRTSPGARIYQHVELRLSRTDETSLETYLGLTSADFARTPNARYAGSQEDRMDVAQRQAMLRHVAVFNDRLDLTTTLYRNTFSRNWYKLQSVRNGSSNTSIANVLNRPDEFTTEMALLRGESVDGRLVVRANNRDYTATGVQSILGAALDLGPAATTLEVGLRYHEDDMDRFQWEDQFEMTPTARMNRVVAGVPGTQDNRINSARALASFVQAEAVVGALTLTPGLRYERITLVQENFGRNDVERVGADLSLSENTVNVLIPGLGARYAVTPSLDVFGGVHRGFAPPTSDPETRPEDSVNFELGFRYETPVVGAQLVGYLNNYDNLLGSDLAAGGGTGSTEQFNGGEVQVYGLEAAASADLAPVLGFGGFRLPLRLAYTLTEATFQSSFESSFGAWETVTEGDQVPYVARHQATASLGVEWARYGFDLRAAYTGDRRDRAGQGAIPDAERLDAHLVVDFSGSLDVDSRTAIFGGVRNVFDATYVAAQRPAGLRPGLPRTLFVGVRTSI